MDSFVVVSRGPLVVAVLMVAAVVAPGVAVVVIRGVFETLWLPSPVVSSGLDDFDLKNPSAS